MSYQSTKSSPSTPYLDADFFNVRSGVSQGIAKCLVQNYSKGSIDHVSNLANWARDLLLGTTCS